MPNQTSTREPGAEPIPGYRLLQPLGKGGFGEVWKCEAPGGLLKAVKFVEGARHALADAPADEELRAIERVKAIRHPFILSMERVESVGGELVIVLELADRNLADLLASETAAGRTGIDREQLLGYLREAAEALDVMNVRHDLQHLDIKPQNLFLVSNHVKVGDFGLVNSLVSAAGGGRAPALQLGAITPVYASPEVFQGTISRHSDQYSLAIVYQELLTGTLPFAGKNARQLLLQHLQGEPDLAALPEVDRAPILRALAKDPAARYPSCSDLVHALVHGQTEVVVSLPPAAEQESPTLPERDTRTTRGLATVRTRSLTGRPPTLPGGAPFPGLTIHELRSRTPLTEVWSATAADGSEKFVKVVFGFHEKGDPARLASLRHPGLLPAEVLHHTAGRLVLGVPAVARNLNDRRHECQAEGSAGIPRPLLLRYLREAADALNYLAGEHALPHLGLNPRTLLLEDDRILLADAGLCGWLWLPASQNVAALNSRYAAPELFERLAGPACDQYSLALVYHEMLTGRLPQAKPTARGSRGPIFCLDLLPEADRAPIARALDPVPERRWPNLDDLLTALAVVSGGVVSGEWSDQTTHHSPLATHTLQSRFGSTLTSEVIRQRLDGFWQQWQGKVISSEPDQVVFQMQTPRSFWQRWTGRQPGLEVRIRLSSAPPVQGPVAAQVRTEIGVDLRPHDCGKEQEGELLKVVGPLLVESVRTTLAVNARGRTQERLVWQYPLQVCSIEDGQPGPAVECQGKDISLNGIGFYLPGQMPSTQVLLHLPQTPQTAQMTVPARVVRVQSCGDGWYEVGAVLLPPSELPAESE
jgi:serine/threonine protein kinase